MAAGRRNRLMITAVKSPGCRLPPVWFSIRQAKERARHRPVCIQNRIYSAVPCIITFSFCPSCFSYPSYPFYLSCPFLLSFLYVFVFFFSSSCRPCSPISFHKEQHPFPGWNQNLIDPGKKQSMGFQGSLELWQLQSSSTKVTFI